MTLPSPPTLHAFLEETARRFKKAKLFFGHGTDNAWDEAVALVLGTLHLPYDLDPKKLDEPLSNQDHQVLLEQVKKRITQHIPVPYLTHEAWFAKMPFYVDERVLIPRSPIWELIENQFEPWINPRQVKNILDLCAGSGCIAIACAKVFKNIHVDASDISLDALEVSKINIKKHHVENQVSLYQSDLFERLPQKQYDIIVSNPPYVSTIEIPTLPLEYKHEPELGLVAGTTGLDIVRRILQDAHHYLSPHGILIVEVGDNQDAVDQAFPHLPFTWLTFERGEGDVFLLGAGYSLNSSP